MKNFLVHLETKLCQILLIAITHEGTPNKGNRLNIREMCFPNLLVYLLFSFNFWPHSVLERSRDYPAQLWARAGVVDRNSQLRVG